MKLLYLITLAMATFFSAFASEYNFIVAADQ
jgi:hypothetical protein